MRTLAIDLETFCDLDINQVGTYKYAENCEILLCAFAYDDAPVNIVDIANGESLPVTFIDALFNPNILKTAYNANFEIQVLSKYLNKNLDTAQWSCTMVLGLSLGLPAGLEKLGKVLNIESDKQKLAIGKKLINFFSKPRNISDSDQTINLWNGVSHNRNLPKNNRDKWLAFKDYCKQDVESERTIRKLLDKYPKVNFEKTLWCLDQKINSYGVLIDMELVDGAIEIDTLIKSEALREGVNLTGGLNINSNQQMLDWVEKQEGKRPSAFDKSARADLKAEVHTPQVKRLLELKDLISKTSIKKYEAMHETACADNRARGMFQFYGANRTGRWAGRLIQLQNLPQNHLDISDLDFARLFVKNESLESLQMFYDNPSEILSQLIRTAFIAPDGHRFIVADFSAIEARVIAWLADEKWRMDVFANGGDIYCASASAMFKVPVEKNGVNKELRAKGKIAELACGYGGGVNALKAFGADKMGLSDSEMETIIKKWRESSPNICQMWRSIETCTKTTILTKNTTTFNNELMFELIDDFLFITLPSSRKIAYYKPLITTDNNRESITYEGTLQASGGWGRNYTWGGKLVENIVQATARDCLAVAMLRLDSAGYKIVMHVHDEIICEMPNDKGSLDEVITIMSKPLRWAKGLLLNADGYETVYYRKD